MGLNHTKGNMYGFTTHTFNIIKGKCEHNCEYCYMKRWGNQKPIRLDQKELKTDLGENNFIFVGSSTDMFAKDVPTEWIQQTLEHCKKYPKNTYLFQTKNPERFLEFVNLFPLNTILGTTIETDNEQFAYKAPSMVERSKWMSHQLLWRFRKMVTIEPIIDFITEPLVNLIEPIRPEFVNIGADSTKNNLPEPTEFKVECLMKELNKFTKVKIKETLKRIKETTPEHFYF